MHTHEVHPRDSTRTHVSAGVVLTFALAHLSPPVCRSRRFCVGRVLCSLAGQKILRSDPPSRKLANCCRGCCKTGSIRTGMLQSKRLAITVAPLVALRGHSMSASFRDDCFTFLLKAYAAAEWSVLCIYRDAVCRWHSHLS